MPKFTQQRRAPVICDFCTKTGHEMSNCHYYIQARTQAHKDTQNRSKRRSHCSSKATTTSRPLSSSPGSAIASPVIEYAGNASSSASTASPSAAIASQLPPHLQWLPDTGATSHMTPHRHWFKTYTPYRTPVRLADDSVVYSTGIGSVVFQPIIQGTAAQGVEFTRVLHVPQLRSNLLSCLYVSQYKDFEIIISGHSMVFKLEGKCRFTASIHPSNSASLDGITQLSESANYTSTLPLDLSLWHKRFIHHNYADVKKMISQNLVTGLKIESEASPDPVCEPCLAGKMHANPFPSSLNHNRSPLDLIHSDVHGPLPVASNQGYKYWITFIDDSTRFRAVYPLKAKSEAFEAFFFFFFLNQHV